jgi:flagellar biosynthesis GTPase FlhF
MTIHTFRARNLSEALRLIRQELGSNASVLSTREVAAGWPRWWSGTQIEVTASADAGPVVVSLRETAYPRAERADHPPAAELFDFRGQFRRALHERASREPSVVEQLSQPRQMPTAAVRGPIRLIPGRQTVVALVGPTGVGKTTTIAKLAALFQIRDERRVGLVTVDTFRIAAVEQLRSYAQIMDLPLVVARTPRDMPAALAQLADCELVLVDTAGRSPRDARQLAELQALLAETEADEIHLVLSAAAGSESLAVAAAAFAGVGAAALIVTKLDEAASLDWLPQLTRQHRLPLSYTTHGQNVPDDIRPAGLEILNSKS